MGAAITASYQLYCPDPNDAEPMCLKLKALAQQGLTGEQRDCIEGAIAAFATDELTREFAPEIPDHDGQH